MPPYFFFFTYFMHKKQDIKTLKERSNSFMYLYEKIQKQKEQEEKYKKSMNVLCNREDEYKKKRYLSVMTSMSHTYGNILAFMQNWILELFPENMFKTIHVNSKIAHRQIRSTPHEFIKKTKPMIIFRPRIPSHDEERFMQGTPLIERSMNINSTWGLTSLQPFFEDHKRDLMIKYQMNRDVMYMDVVVVLSTLMQQLDYYHYLENVVRINHPFMIGTFLESYIPQDMLKIVGDISGVPLYDGNGNTKEFIDYMNGNSIYPITYKLQGSTGTREFYRYYPANIDTIITDLDKDDGERVGNIMDHYTISFTLRCEFNSTGFYYLFNDNVFDIKLPTVPSPADADYIPIFTDVLLNEDLNLKQGWKLYNRASYRLETPDDVVDMNQMFNETIRTAIDYHKKNGLPMFNFIDIKVRKQGHPIHEGKEYDMDWENNKLIFHKQTTYHTYSILVCINIEYVNNLVKDIYNLQ